MHCRVADSRRPRSSTLAAANPCHAGSAGGCELIGGQDPGLDRTPWYTAQVKNRLQFAIFNHEPPSLPTEKQAEAAFRTMFGDRIVEFWTVGPYRLYRLRR